MNRYDIGRRIEAYREKRGMSTQELAERIKRSQATISRIENGKQGLTFELLSAVADELRVHPFALLSDDPARELAVLSGAPEAAAPDAAKSPGLPSTPEEMEQFLDRLSRHLASTLHDSGFRDKVFPRPGELPRHHRS
jgi:transcriptional regulator with XRE-family HTH domain